MPSPAAFTGPSGFAANKTKMDLAFFRRAERMFAGREAARLEHGMFLAGLRARQERCPAARAEERCRVAAGGEGPQPLVRILLGEPAWREAVAARRGSFHPRIASGAMGGVAHMDRKPK
jgi:hypothetical protein